MSQPIELASAGTLQRVLIRTHWIQLGSTLLSKKKKKKNRPVWKCFLQSSVLQKQQQFHLIQCRAKKIRQKRSSWSFQQLQGLVLLRPNPLLHWIKPWAFTKHGGVNVYSEEVEPALKADTVGQSKLKACWRRTMRRKMIINHNFKAKDLSTR